MISLTVKVCLFINAAFGNILNPKNNVYIEEVRLFDWDLLQTEVESYLDYTKCNKSQALCFKPKENM